jgi:hypothetical protein
VQQRLSRALPYVRWRVRTAVDPAVTPPAELTELVDAARANLLGSNCQLLVLLTDLPIKVGRKPVLSHASRTHGIAVVSLPALGAVAVRSKASQAVLATVQALVGVAEGAAAPLDQRRGRGKVGRRLDRRLRQLGHHLDDEDGVLFVARVATGNLHLLAGMVRANQPWRLALRLSRALVAALAAAVAALVTTDIWRLADALGGLRLLLVAVGSIVAIVATLIAGADLWERTPNPSARQQVVLFNVATTATVVLGVTALYAVLFVLLAIATLVIIPPALFSIVVGHAVTFGDRMTLAWLATSVATAGGALGAGLETDQAVRQAAYANRRRSAAARAGTDDAP